MRDNVYALLNPGSIQPSLRELQSVKDVQFHRLKRNQPEVDGPLFVHGIIVAKYHGVLYSCWAENKGEENTETEIVCGCYSQDDGKTWSDSQVWLKGEPGEGISHGVFLTAKDKLWGFFPHFTGLRENVRMYIYQLEEGLRWRKVAKVTDEPFWPLGEPCRMENGNYIMPGLYVGGSYVGKYNPAAVAISNGDNLCEWRVIKIPKPEEMTIWGESGVILYGNKVICIFRCCQEDPVALVSVSEDFGEHWSVTARTNLAMADSKPATGMLSNGKPYLIGTTLADNGRTRYPLTIALGEPGAETFREIKCIRRYEPSFDCALGADMQLRLSYPYATEADGKLYVAYSAGSGTMGNYDNCPELAIINIKNL